MQTWDISLHRRLYGRISATLFAVCKFLLFQILADLTRNMARCGPLELRSFFSNTREEHLSTRTTPSSVGKLGTTFHVMKRAFNEGTEPRSRHADLTCALMSQSSLPTLVMRGAAHVML